MFVNVTPFELAITLPPVVVKSELAQVNRSVCWFISSSIVATCITAVASVMSIPAMVMAFVYRDDPCASSSRYLWWLSIYAWTRAMATVCAMMLSSRFMRSFGFVATAVMLVFLFAWYVFGAVVFFGSVFINCDTLHPLRTFGIAMFIIQTVFIGGTLDVAFVAYLFSNIRIN